MASRSPFHSKGHRVIGLVSVSDMFSVSVAVVSSAHPAAHHCVSAKSGRMMLHWVGDS